MKIGKSDDKDEDWFDDIYGLHCLVCAELFSTEPDSQLAPAQITCGHYVCVGCFDKLKTINEDIDGESELSYSYRCDLCDDTFTTYATDVAAGFTELIGRIRTQLIIQFPNTDNRKNRRRKHYVLNDPHFIEGFTCNRCDVHFSTEASGSNPPNSSYCGHFICAPCSESFQTKTEDGKFQIRCEICDCHLTQDSQMRDVAYGFMAFVAEIEKKCIETQAKNRCEIKCESCNGWAHIDTARVCRTCCENGDRESRSSSICLECAFEKHRGFDHDVVKYIYLKNVEDVKGSEEKSAPVIETYKTIMEETSKNHREEMNNISEALKRVHKHAKFAKTARECSSTLNKLQKQMENFETASEVFVPAARTYSNSLKKIAKCLNDIPPKDQQIDESDVMKIE